MLWPVYLAKDKEGKKKERKLDCVIAITTSIEDVSGEKKLNSSFLFQKWFHHESNIRKVKKKKKSFDLGKAHGLFF